MDKNTVNPLTMTELQRAAWLNTQPGYSQIQGPPTELATAVHELTPIFQLQTNVANSQTAFLGALRDYQQHRGATQREVVQARELEYDLARQAYQLRLGILQILERQTEQPLFNREGLNP